MSRSARPQSICLCPRAVFAAPLDFAPSASRARSLRSLSLRCALGQFRGYFVSQANTAPAGRKKDKMNIVKLHGRLTRDAKYLERSETKVCDMRLAVNGSGKAPTLFIDVAAFGEQAESAAELKKGAEVEVSGSLRYSEWETDGEKRSRHSVIVRELVAA
jgi:single-strand DNA-binding protein